MAERYAVMLCGGSGTRLWPLSRALRPKQLLALNGKQTLLQQTALRLCRHVRPENLIAVTHKEQRFEVKGQLAEVLDRLENLVDESLSIIEVQCGEYVGEDDIVRFEDTYGRSVEK